MPFKPMPIKKFEKWVKALGWTVRKTGFDYSVYDEQGFFVCSVVYQHPGEKVVVADSVRKFEAKLKERGLR